ncbi:hypothetical protein CHS0354_006770 [Potamilus streckersoni]|uniref:Mab-21-like nucleotidyltransferase domain-containing protein n=1 Tax=Potamilus streckersoni TaxID=2493646 RepID=A0AAE0S8C8_9BIVA|nr:hypothetical protein CHS0354_006770 [Potamilus streckersoni]
MNFPDYYEGVSQMLTEVLDASGLKDDLRWRRINTSLQTEELERIWFETITGPEARLYYFGSQTEATTTPGLSSDIDKVVLNHNYVVLQDLQFWKPNIDTVSTFLMVADESSPPGYVKMQLVQRDAPMTVRNYQDKNVLDSEGRSVLPNGFLYESSGKLLGYLMDQFDRHGLAITTSRTGTSLDLVYAVLSPCWPDQVFRGMSTPKNYNWPTRPMMDVIKQTPVFVVPVGHKLSPEQHLEWRLSFSFAEKLLMMQFNSTQYKCYIMLKFIKNTFINVDAVENVLTSYHCKTSSQSLKKEMYNQENLIAAHKLLLWGSSSDVAAGKLKLATFYLAQGKIDTMEDLLNEVHANFTQIVFEQGDKLIQRMTLSHILYEDLTAANFIQNCLALMVCYSSSDIHSIPNVLIFEIFRSTGSELCIDLTPSVTLNVAAVRARIYLYFLQYQCFYLQGRVSPRLAALNNIILVLTDYYQKLLYTMQDMIINLQTHYFRTFMLDWLGYVTTSLNLMSYCLKQDGRQLDEFKVLCLSMKLKNQHNAAKWQISVCISSSMRILWARQ